MPTDAEGFINQITEKLGLLVDAHGLKKALLTVEIMQMLSALHEGIKNQEEADRLEKKALIDQLNQLQREKEEASNRAERLKVVCQSVE